MSHKKLKKMTVGIIKKAIQSAKKSRMYPYKVGCVCFKGAKILSYGFNQKRSCVSIPDKYKRHPCSLHAEQHAISKIRDKSVCSGASILVVRIGNCGNLLMAKPCSGCYGIIIHYGFKRIYYSNAEGEIVLYREEGGEYGLSNSD